MIYFVLIKQNTDLISLKIFGYSNFKIVMILSVTCLVMGFLVLLTLNPITSNMIKYYEDIKSRHSRDTDHLFTITKNGVWIKEHNLNQTKIITAKSLNYDELLEVTIFEMSEDKMSKRIEAKNADITSNNWVLNDVKIYNPDEVVLLPWYPQYSAATSGSSIKEWHDVCKENKYKTKTSTICCYPIDNLFIKSHVEEIKPKIKNLEDYKLIFSAHGLPEKNIKKGDPYQWQVEQSVNKIVKSINFKDLDWILSYQSRVGPLKWIGPSTEDIIVENSKLGKHIVLVPIAFVSEHSETLVELDIEYKELADKNGCKNYLRVPALGSNENYIKAMTNLIINKQKYNFNGKLFPPKTQCPKQFKKCPCLSYE